MAEGRTRVAGNVENRLERIVKELLA